MGKQESSLTDKPEVDKEKEILKDTFSIVGIGASAGGLEALQEFFDHMQENPGVAFVIVQHLSPDYKSFMSELLARHTLIPIDVASDNMKIEKNHIYLIPPRMNMTINNKHLYLKEIQGRSLNLPIDIFFRSLALDQESNAIGIILSGTGSDGSLGIRAIKEQGGMTMAQDDQTAKFDGMPRSSISTGLVDFIASPEKLAHDLIDYVKHPLINHYNTIENQLMQNQSLFSKIIAILHEAKGVDFSSYKQNTIVRRLEKRISINRFLKITDYVSYLQITPKEISALFNDLLIGVTRFFRDEKFFDLLISLTIPGIFNQQPTAKGEIRIWVPACSTGEEAYSIAILFKEYMTKHNIIKDIKIFATDIDEESLAFAGLGVYPSNITADVPSQLLVKYFTRKDNGYQINDNIRRMIIFARHNIIDEPPFSKLDFISCRNFLIYIDPEVQQKILGTFYVCLKSDGFLFLGSSESLGKLSEAFDTVDNKAKIYKKKNKYKLDFIPTSSHVSLHRNRSEMMQTFNNPTGKSGRQLGDVFEYIMHEFLPPSVIIDSQANILYTVHDVSKYLHIPKGVISINLLKMLPKDISIIVSSLIRRTGKKQRETTFDDIEMPDKEKKLSISCKWLGDSGIETPCFIVTFIEKSKTKEEITSPQTTSIKINTHYQERIEELERELLQKNESLQATVEELETSNEELQSSNEELIASNEELQSTNEELQSVNEELYTVNSEHLRKIEELTELNADFDNLLKNTFIGNIFLDSDLVIRKINDVASVITTILPGDIGRPIHHLALKSMYKRFLEDIEQVADTLSPIERDILYDEQFWYFMRILPYRAADNTINGVIITFVEMTNYKKSQIENESLSNKLQQMLEQGDISLPKNPTNNS